MNALERISPGLLGSPDALSNLENADSARLLVIADTHGHYEVLEAIIREYGPSSDVLLFAGDGMWDIVQYLENAQESDKLKAALPPVLAFVSGNGDGDEYRVSLPSADVHAEEDAPGVTLSVPVRLIVKASGYAILLVHGHRYSVDVNPEILVDVAHSLDCDIAIHGHTHLPFAEEYSHILVLNPGSPSRPRGQSRPGFAFVDLESTGLAPRVTFCTVEDGARGSFSFIESPAIL
jgi:putative phosphoesterase